MDRKGAGSKARAAIKRKEKVAISMLPLATHNGWELFKDYGPNGEDGYTVRPIGDRNYYSENRYFFYTEKEAFAFLLQK